MSNEPPEANANRLRLQLDALFEPWNRTDAPGLLVGIARAGEVIYRRGFGMASLETAVANTPKTRMRIGSSGKHFTSLLALLLAEEGKLDIDRPLRAYLPGLDGPGGEPTLRQLMQHRGGSRCYLDLAFLGHGWWAQSPSGAALEAQARQRGRNFAPGEAMIYNNSGYHLLSLVIQKVGGAAFEEQLHARLFSPLGMSDTASVPSDFQITPGIATMHVAVPEGGWRRGLFQTEDLRGEGAIVSTIDDMLCWTSHLRSRDRFGSAATWSALTNPTPHSDGTPGAYALGLINGTYRGLKILHHPGGVLGGSSSMMTLPESSLDVVILSNGAPGADPLRLSFQALDIVLQDQLGELEPEVASTDYAACLGDWWSARTGMVYSLIDESGLLKVQVCKTDMLGNTLRRGSHGRAFCPELSIGRIELELTRTPTDRLTIHFAGTPADYERVAPHEVLPEFTNEIVGRYYSADADVMATIRSNGATPTIQFADGFGYRTAILRQLGPTAVFTDMPPPSNYPRAVLNFSFAGASAGGFTLNSIRTRNLEFTRVGPQFSPPFQTA
jgi:D-aminopeptidase